MKPFNPNATADFCMLSTFNHNDRPRMSAVRHSIKGGIYEERVKERLTYNETNWRRLHILRDEIIRYHRLNEDDITVTYGCSL